MPVSRLTLTDFRSYASATLDPGPGFVLLSGENGAGKTNILEAVSLLAPGRGLRGAALGEMARQGGDGRLRGRGAVGETDIGTGTLVDAPERRQVRINGAPAAVNSLGEHLAVLWVTPAMDRLFTGAAGERRRFLDRLVLALEPTHAHHSARYEAAMRAKEQAARRGAVPTKAGWPRSKRRWPNMARWLPRRARAPSPRSRSGWQALPRTNSPAAPSRSRAGTAAISPLRWAPTAPVTPLPDARC